MNKILLPIFIALILVGCGGGSNTPTKYSNTQQNFTIDSDDVTSNTIEKTADSKITLNLETYKDVYVAVTSRFKNQDISISDSISSNKIENSYREVSNSKSYIKTPQKVIDFRDKIAPKLLKSSRGKKLQEFRITSQKRVTTLGDEDNFCIDMGDKDHNCTKHITLKARKIVDSVETKFGDKKLVIWVPDSEYNSDVTDSMLDELADKFLQDGDANDIYDWDTNVHGKEWGGDAQNIDKDVISGTDTIDIALYDMHNNSVAGYFWAKDMFTKSTVPASNERVMIYVNSKMYRANKEEVFTTLAHEFTHLINFYHRDILLGLNDHTWFKEFLAETTENLVASKLNYNVIRYKEFNEKNYYPITSWYDSIYNYATVHSFGAFLLRNYGGAKLLHNISLNKNSDEQAIMDATGVKDFTKLIREFSEAYLLSDRDNLKDSIPKFNYIGTIHSHYGNVTYDLKPINFYSYDPEPTFYSGGTLKKDATLYYKVGENLIGDITIDIKIEKGADVEIITQ